jgi:hypothetical protein
MNQTESSDSNQPVKINIAIPSRNLVGYDLCGDLAIALFKMQQDPRYDVSLKIWPGFGVDVVRNQIVAAFLQSDAQFLLMIDDDMIPPDDLLEMAAYDCDIVGALYYAWNIGSGPFVAAYWEESDGQYARPKPGYIENTGLREITLVGGGCIMIHRRVLEAIPVPWFSFETDAAGQKIITPEDFLICRKAISHGFKVFLDTDRVCGHIKRVDLRDVVALSNPRKKNPLLELLE